MTYWVGRTPFDTKDEAHQFFKRLKDDASGPLSDEEQDLVLALVGQTKPEKLREVGLRVITKPNQISGDIAFYIQTPRGHLFDFSYIDAVKKLPSGKVASRDKMPDYVIEYGKAARSAVAPQTIAFRNEFWDGRAEAICPVSGKPMTRSSSAVDHHPRQFAQLLRQFTVEQSLRISSIEVRSPNGEVREFVDESLRERWCEFHARHAELRVIDSLTNSKLPKVLFEWKDIR